MLACCRQLVALAHSLVDTAPTLERTIRGGDSPWVAVQVAAGCNALVGLQAMALACLPHLPSQTAFKISAGCSLVFGPGAALIEAQLSPQTAAAFDSIPCSRIELYGSQAAAVGAFFHGLLHPPHQPRAVAAFAGSTGKPEVLLPWLLGLCRVLPVAADHPDSECADSCMQMAPGEIVD